MSATVESEAGWAERTLGEIASTVPGATAIFRRYKLDFCCGGQVSLARAAREKNLPLTALESDLAGVAALGLPAKRPEETDALIAYIETRFHAVHRQELPELARLARKVEAVHKAHADVPRGLADLLATMATDLNDHMTKEEQVLFPLMRRGGHPMIGHPIAAMLAEHDDHGVHLRALEALTADHTPPSDACMTWRALYAGTLKFADDLMQHIHTENSVLFPRFL